MRTRIRVIIWKQWKKITRREKALIQLGVEKEIEPPYIENLITIILQMIL